MTQHGLAFQSAFRYSLSLTYLLRGTKASTVVLDCFAFHWLASLKKKLHLLIVHTHMLKHAYMVMHTHLFMHIHMLMHTRMFLHTQNRTAELNQPVRVQKELERVSLFGSEPLR